MNATEVGCEFGQSHLRCDMEPRDRKGVEVVGIFPVFDIDECTREGNFPRKIDFAFAQGGRVPERVSECPYGATQSLFKLGLA